MERLIRDLLNQGELKLSPFSVTAKGGLAITALFILVIVFLFIQFITA